MNSLIIDIIKDVFGECVNSFSNSEYSIKGSLLGTLKIDIIDENIYKELKLSYKVFSDVRISNEAILISEFKLPLLKNQPLEEIVIPFVTGVRNFIQDIDPKYEIFSKVDRFLMVIGLVELVPTKNSLTSVFTYRVLGKYDNLIIRLDPVSILVEHKNRTRAFPYEFTEELKSYLLEKINEC